MRIFLLPAAIAIGLLAGLGTAAGSAPKAKSKAHGAGEKEATAKPKEGLFGSADNIVPLPVLIAPVVAENRLISHLYLFLAAVTPSAKEAEKLKEKLPYVLDDLVLTVYTPPAHAPDALAEPDYKNLVARIRASINRSMGHEIVTQIEIGKVDTAPY